MPELKKFNENVDDDVFPNVPLTKFRAPEIPTPEPNLALPLTPKPPVTVKAPEVEDVELVLLEITVFPNTFNVDLNVTAPVTPRPLAILADPRTPKPPDISTDPVTPTPLPNLEAPRTSSLNY